MAEQNAQKVLKRVNHTFCNDDEIVIYGLAIGTIVDFTNCVVTKMQFIDEDGNVFKPTTTTGQTIDRDFYSVSVFESAAKAKKFIESKGTADDAKPIASYSFDALRYKGRVSKTLSYIGQNVFGNTKLAIQNSLRKLGKLMCIDLPEETSTDGLLTRKGSEWKEVEG